MASFLDIQAFSPGACHNSKMKAMSASPSPNFGDNRSENEKHENSFGSLADLMDETHHQDEASKHGFRQAAHANGNAWAANIMGELSARVTTHLDSNKELGAAPGMLQPPSLLVDEPLITTVPPSREEMLSPMLLSIEDLLSSNASNADDVTSSFFLMKIAQDKSFGVDSVDVMMSSVAMHQAQSTFEQSMLCKRKKQQDEALSLTSMPSGLHIPKPPTGKHPVGHEVSTPAKRCGLSASAIHCTPSAQPVTRCKVLSPPVEPNQSFAHSSREPTRNVENSSFSMSLVDAPQPPTTPCTTARKPHISNPSPLFSAPRSPCQITSDRTTPVMTLSPDVPPGAAHYPLRPAMKSSISSTHEASRTMTDSALFSAEEKCDEKQSTPTSTTMQCEDTTSVHSGSHTSIGSGGAKGYKYPPIHFPFDDIDDDADDPALFPFASSTLTSPMIIAKHPPSRQQPNVGKKGVVLKLDQLNSTPNSNRGRASNVVQGSPHSFQGVRSPQSATHLPRPSPARQGRTIFDEPSPASPARDERKKKKVTVTLTSLSDKL